MVLALLGTVVAGCGADGDVARVIEVSPGSSIQEAVDRARAGDVVLVAAGTYYESVVIDRAGITLRGADRNATILDGQGSLGNGVMVMADGVTVENLTVHHYTVNGVVFTGVESADDTSQLNGFRMAYLTSYDNGLYGLYAFQARNGEIVDSYASGNQDSGVYVGQCGNPFREAGSDGTVPADAEPCDVLVRGVTAEYNAVGYEGTNASQVWVVESTFRHNRVGLTPNSQSLERRPPATESVIAGNLVVDNDSADAPEQASGAIGLGIAVGSGVGNLIINNRVDGHSGVGILVTTLDKFSPFGNRVEGNVLSGNALDLGYWLVGGSSPSQGNCFTGNEFESSSPADIERALPCDGNEFMLDAPVVPSLNSPAGPRPGDVPAPPAQPTMPGDVRAFAPKPAFTKPDLASITVPAAG